MRVLKRDLKGNEGEISLRVESLDDLWHLKHLISPGNLVFAQTQRKISSATDKLRPEKAERRTVRLGVGVESVEFHTHSNWLRIHGVIKAGLDVGSYHTLNIEVGSDLSIIRRWRGDQLQRIEEAVAESNQPLVVLALIEEGEATLGVLRQFGVQTVSEVRMGSGKGSGQDRRGEFLEMVASQINQAATGDTRVVVAGPGFAKEDLKKALDSRYPELAERVIMDDATSIGRSGFSEVLRRGAVERVVQNCRLAKEASLIERLMEEVATDGRATYGLGPVQRAVDFGAVETLLVLDELARRREVEDLMQRVANGRGRTVVFSSEFEPGQRLESLGGLAALLRFKIEPA